MSQIKLTPTAAAAGNTPEIGELVEPTGEEIFGKIDSGVFRRLAGYVKPYSLLLVGALLAVSFYVLAQLTLPHLIRLSVDSMIGKPGSLGLKSILAIFLGVVTFNAAVSWLQEVGTALLAQRVIFDLRRAMFEHLQRISLSLMDRTHVGRIMSRLQGDVNALQEFFETSIAAIGDLILLVGIATVLIFVEWRLALLTLSLLPVLVLARALWLPYARKTFSRARDTSSTVNGALAENINGVRVVVGSLREAENLKGFFVKVTDNFNAQIAASKISQIMIPVVDIGTGIAMALGIVVGSRLGLTGYVDTGVMVAFMFYIQRLFDPIRTVSMQYTMLQRATAAAHRIFEVLDVPVSITDKVDAIDKEKLTPSIEFKNVSFGYKPGQTVLKNLSFKVEPKQVVALVGATGSGKTSIASLIQRFYDVTEGEVLVGGHDVRDLTSQTLSRNITVVLQEPFLFTGTVLENIRYASSWATREDIIRVAQAVKAHGFIQELENGYDTDIGQRGQSLSIGQRQLISFARALLADPQILILDEATASIDSFVEAEIQEALQILLQGRTSIIIAHRLATVRDADHIIVLRKGEILEQGSHHHLLGIDGYYATLFRKNFASFEDAEP